MLYLLYRRLDAARIARAASRARSSSEAAVTRSPAALRAPRRTSISASKFDTSSRSAAATPSSESGGLGFAAAAEVRAAPPRAAPPASAPPAELGPRASASAARLGGRRASLRRDGLGGLRSGLQVNRARRRGAVPVGVSDQVFHARRQPEPPARARATRQTALGPPRRPPEARRRRAAPERLAPRQPASGGAGAALVGEPSRGVRSSRNSDLAR